MLLGFSSLAQAVRLPIFGTCEDDKKQWQITADLRSRSRKIQVTFESKPRMMFSSQMIELKYPLNFRESLFRAEVSEPSFGGHDEIVLKLSPQGELGATLSYSPKFGSTGAWQLRLKCSDWTFSEEWDLAELSDFLSFFERKPKNVELLLGPRINLKRVHPHEEKGLLDVVLEQMYFGRKEDRELLLRLLKFKGDQIDLGSAPDLVGRVVDADDIDFLQTVLSLSPTPLLKQQNLFMIRSPKMMEYLWNTKKFSTEDWTTVYQPQVAQGKGVPKLYIKGPQELIDLNVLDREGHTPLTHFAAMLAIWGIATSGDGFETLKWLLEKPEIDKNTNDAQGRHLLVYLLASLYSSRVFQDDYPNKIFERWNYIFNKIQEILENPETHFLKDVIVVDQTKTSFNSPERPKSTLSFLLVPSLLDLEASWRASIKHREYFALKGLKLLREQLERQLEKKDFIVGSTLMRDLVNFQKRFYEKYKNSAEFSSLSDTDAELKEIIQMLEKDFSLKEK